MSRSGPACFICELCEEEISLVYSRKYNELLRSRARCFSCNFWEEIIRDKVKYIRYKGWCYRIYPNDEAGPKGHGGCTFRIIMKDSSELTTSNLWCQGEVPQRFRDELDDTADVMAPNSVWIPHPKLNNPPHYKEL